MESSQSVLSSDHRNERDSDGLPSAVADLLSRLRHGSSDQRIGIVPEDSAGLRPVEPPIHASPSRRPRGLKNDQFASDRPSFGRRIFRSVARFLVVALIGAGVTLAWQSYGDEAKEIAKEMVRARVPSLAWLLPVSTMKSSPTGQVTPVATITSPELAQQLKPMAIDLALVRRSVEELAAQQKQMAQSLTTLQAVEQDKMSSSPPSEAVPMPPRKNATKVAAPQATAMSSSPPSRAVPMSARNIVPSVAAPQPTAMSSSPPSRAVPMSARNIVPSVAAPQPSAQSSFQSSSVSPPPPPGQPYLPELDLGPPHAN